MPSQNQGSPAEGGPATARGRRKLNWRGLLTDGLQLVAGGLVAAVAIDLFIAPHNIAPGGASGLAIILTTWVSAPLGLMMLVINVPAFVVGFRKLGGGGFLVRSLVATVVFNVSVDLLGPYIPKAGVTDEMILNALFGGLVLGAGIGLIYRAGGAAGAGSIVNRLLQTSLGLPIKISTLYANSVVIALAGFVFGWEAAMYALITFFVTGSVADFVLEGPSVVRTALIITDRAPELAEALMVELGRGVSRWTVEGMYTHRPHQALYCTVTRPQIHTLKQIVSLQDPDAFVIIGQGHEALGQGFRQLEPQEPVLERMEAGPT